MLGFYTTPRLALGTGALQQLSALESQRTLVVLDPAVANGAAATRALEELRKMEGTVESVTIPAGEPSVASVEALAGPSSLAPPDWIVGIGGGSAIDTAKALWVRRCRRDLAWSSISPLTSLGLRDRCRFAAVPTTVASGSEATWVAHLHDSEGGFQEVASRELVPDWGILDPSFLATLPASLAAEGTADTLAHAFEAFGSEWANPFSDAHARAAIAVALPALGRIVRRWDDDLQEPLLYASTQAGIAASNAQSGIGHALAHALSTEFPVRHARLSAALLPYVLEFNYPSARERFRALGPMIGAALVEHRSSLSQAIRAAAEASGLPRTLVDAGIPAESLESRLNVVVERALRMPGVVSNPRVPSADEAARLLRAASAGGIVDF